MVVVFGAASLICDNVLSRHTNRGSTDGSVMLGGTDKVKFVNMNWEEKREVWVRYLAFMNTAMNIWLRKTCQWSNVNIWYMRFSLRRCIIFSCYVALCSILGWYIPMFRRISVTSFSQPSRQKEIRSQATACRVLSWHKQTCQLIALTTVFPWSNWTDGRAACLRGRQLW